MFQSYSDCLDLDNPPEFGDLRRALRECIAERDGAAERMREACLAICADYGKDIKNDAIKQVFAEHVCSKIAARISELPLSR